MAGSEKPLSLPQPMRRVAQLHTDELSYTTADLHTRLSCRSRHIFCGVKCEVRAVTSRSSSQLRVGVNSRFSVVWHLRNTRFRELGQNIPIA